MFLRSAMHGIRVRRINRTCIVLLVRVDRDVRFLVLVLGASLS